MTAFAIAAVVAFAACGTDDNTRPADPSAAGSAPAAGGIANGADAFTAAGFDCATGNLRSSGSTAQGKAMAAWITAYNELCGATITDYGGGGSGRGLTDFTSAQTDFGGSDSAMDARQKEAAAERCLGNEAINLPLVTGPIAIPFQLSGVERLVLTADVLSGIFGGSITAWNDPQIVALNTGTTLPDLAITSVHRAEDSGTTDNFTTYLAAAADWNFPAGKAWSAPGGIGAQGSDGVVKAVAATAGSIGYVEWGFALQADLTIAEIDNGSGPVMLNADSAALAVAAATVVGSGNDLALHLDYATTQPGAYPIVLVTYEMVCAAGNGDAAALLKSFLGFAATEGQAMLADVGAAPLPEEIRERVIDVIRDLR